jgi:hypothetical protein
VFVVKTKSESRNRRGAILALAQSLRGSALAPLKNSNAAGGPVDRSHVISGAETDWASLVLLDQQERKL